MGLPLSAVAPDFDRKKVDAITIESNDFTLRNTDVRLSIAKMSLVKSWNLVYAAMAGGLIFYWVLCFVLFNRGILRRRFGTPMPYIPVDMKNYADDQTTRLVTWLASNFTDADLNIPSVAKATGIAADRVSALLNAYCSLSFKQYLIELRVTEARRLLQATDRQVTEIALAVGFNHPSTFNRVFKNLTGLSPTEYRKKQ